MTKHAIPVEVLAQHTAILGKTGSGKTSTSKLAVEQVVADGFHVCVLDTIKSDWWGLISSSDGKKPGLPFKVLGGPRGHVPLHASAGKAIGRLVGSGKLPLSIVDMADFEPGGVQKFFSEFAAELMRSMQGVLYLVIEEAHEVAPKERAGFGGESICLHYAKKLATAGRSKGIRLIVATQRVQSLHNAVLGSCETVIAHRLGTPADQAPVVGWLKANTDKATAADVESSLSSLPTGTAWVCSGEARIFEKIAFPKFSTYDNARTPTRDSHGHNVKTAPVDLDELRAIMGDAVAEAEANDPKALKAQIADLKKQLSGKVAVTVATGGKLDEEIKAAVDKAIAEARPKIFAEGRRVGDAEGEKRALARAADAVAGLKSGDATLAALPARAATSATVSTLSPPTKPSPAPAITSAQRAPTTGVQIPKAERLILTALAQYPSGRTKSQVALLTGYSSAGGGFKNALGALRSKGWIEGSHILRATDKGAEALGPFDPLPLGEALLQHWYGQLGKAERAILTALAQSYPAALTKDQIAQRAGYDSGGGGFKNALGRLRTLELITGRGELKASDDLFSEAA